jgi:hypothetical protein
MHDAFEAALELAHDHVDVDDIEDAVEAANDLAMDLVERLPFQFKRAYHGGPTEGLAAHLLNLLALLRAQAFSYQHSHWQVVGQSFYGNHLLFERLYGSVGKQIDELAEKIAGYVGSEALSPDSQADLVARWVKSWSHISCHHERGLMSEETALAAIEAAYEGIKAEGSMTLGLDDWLMATASAHEEGVYLLQQQLAKPPLPPGQAVDPVVPHHPPPAARWASEAVAPSAESAFFDNPNKRSVREMAESKAPTNIPEVAAEAPEATAADVEAAMEAPPTPTEIREEPGGDVVSTLNQYLVETEEPTSPAVPDGHHEVPKHPEIKLGADKPHGIVEVLYRVPLPLQAGGWKWDPKVPLPSGEWQGHVAWWYVNDGFPGADWGDDRPFIVIRLETTGALVVEGVLYNERQRVERLKLDTSKEPSASTLKGMVESLVRKVEGPLRRETETLRGMRSASALEVNRRRLQGWFD